MFLGGVGGFVFGGGVGDVFGRGGLVSFLSDRSASFRYIFLFFPPFPAYSFFYPLARR